MTLRKFILLVLALCILAAGVMTLCYYHGLLLFNHPSQTKYPVRGIDVSSYQGEIDWEVLAAQDLSFAFIKATEGSGYQDAYFPSNWEGARKTALRVGAYHFFSFESPGQTQAENFIATVPRAHDALPPVVDFEFYAGNEGSPPDPGAIRFELDVMLAALEAHYEVRPIIYATEQSYEAYLAGHYRDYDIWIRNVFTKPMELTGQDWTFWQYTNRARLQGYEGKERFIDMNVFAGSLEEFMRYP